jgi:hypothetical protein
MTDDNNVVELPPSPPKRKRQGWPKGKPRAKATAAVEAMPEEFAGLTENSCCDACTPARCVISGTLCPAHDVPAHVNHFGQMIAAASFPDSTICGHPLKTPVNVIISDPKAVDRYQRAKKILEHLILDSRNKGITRGR